MYILLKVVKDSIRKNSTVVDFNSLRGFWPMAFFDQYVSDILQRT